MSDESGRKGTGRMKPRNLTHSRSKNELDELPERDSKRQYGTNTRVPVVRFKFHCIFRPLVLSLLPTAAKSHPNVTAFQAPPFPFFFLSKIFFIRVYSCHDSLSVRLPTVPPVSSFLLSSRIPCFAFAVLIPHLHRTTVRRRRRCICVYDILEDLQLLQIPRPHSLQRFTPSSLLELKQTSISERYPPQTHSPDGHARPVAR
jgi:hypothetical protein